MNLSVGPPEHVAGYTLIREIGRGGMSTVYLAEQRQLNRKVAVKVLDPELASSATFRKRFTRESRTVAALEHPHIVPIYDAGEFEGLLYLVMRYVEHQELRAVLADYRPLPLGRVLNLAEQLGGALGVAHDAGLVHRDIKPANVLVATDKSGAGAVLPQRLRHHETGRVRPEPDRYRAGAGHRRLHRAGADRGPPGSTAAPMSTPWCPHL